MRALNNNGAAENEMREQNNRVKYQVAKSLSLYNAIKASDR